MTANIIQARYDELDAIAAHFGQQAEASAALHERVRRGVEALEDGGWEGQGAAAFFAESHGEITPALQRLQQALDEARAVTLEAKDILRAAEEEAAALFGGAGPGIGVGGAVGTVASLAAGASNGSQPETGVLERIAQLTGPWGVMISLSGGAVSDIVQHFTEPDYQPKHAAKGRPRFRPSFKGGTHAAKEFPGSWLLKPFLKGARGARVLPFLGPLIDTGLNVFEFGWGENKDEGLASREFATATTADVSAGLAFAGVGALVGSVVPGPGNLIGFAVGAGLGLAYEAWFKDDWRNAVDQAAQGVGDAAQGVGDAATVVKGAWNRLFG